MTLLSEKTTKNDQKVAASASLQLRKTARRMGSRKKGAVVGIKIKDEKEYLLIPAKAFSYLQVIIENMAEGKSVALVPEDTELSTQEAADILRVSRPHVVKLLESGEIEYRKIGAHRRILLKDINEYEKKFMRKRKEQLHFLSKQAQELKMGY